MENSPNPPLSADIGVKKSKDTLLKERLQTLIKAKGLSESEFYNSLGLSKQYWYWLSWGLWEPTIELKVKISKALGTDSCVIWKEDTRNE